MTERRLDAEFLLEVLDSSPGIVFVVDADLSITWANRATERLLDYELDEVIGRSVLDFIDVDWSQRSIESIATALGSHGLRPPILFRVLAKDGSRPIIEVQANIRLDDPTVGGIVVHARRWTAQWLLDRTLDSVAAGDPISETLGLLVQVLGVEPMDAPGAFVFDPVGDRVGGAVAAPGLPLPLRGPVLGVSDEVAAAWAGLMRTDEGRVHDVEALPEPLRELASDQGHRSLWIWPTDLDEHRVPRVWAIAWRDEPKVDDDQTRTDLMARLSAVSALALTRWRTEIANAYAASHDDMTGLWNRASILDHLGAALDPDEADDATAGVGVVYLDLDSFKPVNDRYGHAAGDRVLTEVAHRLARAAPAVGRTGRMGGDEFVYVGPAQSPEDIERVAAALADAIEAPIELRADEVVRVGASAGTAFAVPGTMTLDEILDRADRRLYAAKHAKR